MMHLRGLKDNVQLRSEPIKFMSDLLEFKYYTVEEFTARYKSPTTLFQKYLLKYFDDFAVQFISIFRFSHRFSEI